MKEEALRGFRRTVLESELDLVVSSSALQSAWMLAMAGVAVPHVRPHAAHLRGLYAPPSELPAAVFLPEQPDKLTFWEQYEMAMPLWLPSADFWVRVHALGEFRYSVFARRWAAALPEGDGASGACGLPAPLFFEAGGLEELHADSPVTAAFWFHLTDYSIFPHLGLFDPA